MPDGSVVLVLLSVAALASGSSTTESPAVGLPLTGSAAVEFLRTAEVEGRPRRFDPLAITEPERVTLTDGSRSIRAIFKDEDTYHLTFRFADGRVLRKVKDSYKHEIAAYELDQLLELGIVPPCVERKIGGDTGSLCLWVEGAMTEATRIRQEARPPDLTEWNQQMFTIRLFHQLIWDPDFNNTRNTLVDASFKIYKVDSSMSFRMESDLRNEESLVRFSRQVLKKLEALERAEVDARLGRWLNERQLEGLWMRRCRLLELARERIKERGEGAVLFP